MTENWRRSTVICVLMALGGIGACSEHIGPKIDPPPVDSLIVSDPVVGSAIAHAPAVQSAGVSATDVAYVSLASNTIPNGEVVVVRNPATGDSVTTAMVDGGFDPVAITASVGATVVLDVRTSDGGTISFTRVVPGGRRPVVVRTEPPPRKRDQPLNAAIVVVFSEPVSASTVSSAIQLFRGSTRVGGTVRVLQGNGSAVAFTATTRLIANTEYHLVVTQAVRDLDDEALAGTIDASFTTGQSLTGPAASLQILPDSGLSLGVGTTYQLTAIVRDAAGNQLIGQPVTWSTSNSGALSVSPTGVLAALQSGGSIIEARSGVLSDTLSVEVRTGAPASVTLAPSSTTVPGGGDTIVLAATVRDSAGSVINWTFLSWTSSDATTANVVQGGSAMSGKVTGGNPGSVSITATATNGVSGTAIVTVTAPRSVASVTIEPSAGVMVMQAKQWFFVSLKDSNDEIIVGRPIIWTTGNPAVATVDANGLVTAVDTGLVDVIATSEGVSDTASITVLLIDLTSVVAGWRHSCGLTSSGAAYCWGAGQHYGQHPSYFGFPTAVRTGIRFSALDAGDGFTCGLTAAGAAYCWGGGNVWGQLGNGSTDTTSVPVAVAGGHRFVVLSAGGDHTCGITTSGAAYCWGSNSTGQLGNGSTTSSPVPLAVTGGLSFSAISATTLQGVGHTCGVTTGGAVYCWGHNAHGQLGDGTTTDRLTPVRALGGLNFVMVSAGGKRSQGHTCGATTAGAAYCWGYNGRGQLGDGTTTDRTVPVAVLGGLSFTSVTAGGDAPDDWSGHTCGVTTGRAAYCWGGNGNGTLGDGTAIDRATPVAVLGGLTFEGVSAGSHHTCGATPGGVGYCWGDNSWGELGTGKGSDTRVPAKVAGQP